MNAPSRPHARLAALLLASLAAVTTACGDETPTVASDALPPDANMAVTGPGEYDLIDDDDVTVNGARWLSGLTFKVGTGVIDPFLSVQDAPAEEGFNTDASPLPYDDTRSNFTDALPLNVVPVIKVDDVLYREVILDANEADNGVAAQFSIDVFDLWLCDNAAAPDFDEYADFEGGAGCVKVYDLGTKDGVAARLLATDGKTNGSGNSLDYDILIPNDAFTGSGLDLTGCGYNPEAPSCGVYMILKTHMGGKGGDYVTGSTFEEYSTVRRPYVNVTKTAETSMISTFDWTIDKSVAPETWDLFTGDQGTSEYTVAVTKGNPVNSGWEVTGEIEITNPSTGAAVISSVSDVISGGGGADIPVSVSCGVTFPHSLAAGATLTCSYTQALPDGADRLNTASVELESGAVTDAAADIDFEAAEVTEVLGGIDVEDTNGESWHFDDSGSVTYERTFACDADEGTHDNTATITQTGASDDASVTVNCYALLVEKDAATSLTRTWTWTVDKSIDADFFLDGTYDEVNGIATVLPGEILQVKYDILLDATSADSDWAVEGDISISNPNPSLAATVNDVADVISPAIAASVDCGVAFPTSIAAGEALECTYDADLPDGSDRENTATATLQNHSYDSEGVGTPTGTTDFDGDADVSFADPAVTEIDECVSVNDVLEQGGIQVGDTEDLGVYCASSGLPEELNVYREFGGDTGIALDCGENVFTNTATATTDDTQTEVSDDATITIVVDCADGCTLTQGYWKTHNESFQGGAPADETWLLLDGGLAENTVFFLSGQTWFDVFWTAPKGNVYYSLAHQYMAAVLNGLAGADQSAVSDELAAAQALFETYTPAQVGALKGNNAVRAQFIELAGTLGSYNEGLIGPGHCTENEAQEG